MVSKDKKQTVNPLNRPPIDRDEDTKRLAIRGVVFNWLGRACAFGIVFVVTPIVVRRLGNDAYGIWSIMMSMTGFYALADLGLRGGTIKFVSQYLAIEDNDSANQVASTAFAVYAVIAAGLMVVVTITAFFFPLFFHSDAVSDRTLQLVVVLTGTAVCCSVVGQIFDSALMAAKRFDLTNMITLGAHLIQSILIVAVVSLGAQLIAMALIVVFVAIAKQWTTYFIAVKFAGIQRPQLRSIRRDMGMQLFHFSVLNTIQAMGRYASKSSGPILIGSLLGPVQVTYFSIAAALTDKSSEVSKGIRSVLMPVASHLDAQNRRDELGRVFLMATRLLTAAGCCAATVFVCLAGPLVDFWIEPGYSEHVAPLLLVLACSVLIQMASDSSLSILRGTNQMHLLAITGGLEMVTTVVLGYFFVRTFGVIGMAYAMFVTQGLLTGLSLPWFASSSLGLTLPQFFGKGILPGLVAILPGALLTYLLTNSLPPVNLAGVLAYIALMVVATIFGMAFVCLDGNGRRDIAVSLKGKSKLRKRKAPSSGEALTEFASVSEQQEISSAMIGGLYLPLCPSCCGRMNVEGSTASCSDCGSPFPVMSGNIIDNCADPGCDIYSMRYDRVTRLVRDIRQKGWKSTWATLDMQLGDAAATRVFEEVVDERTSVVAILAGRRTDTRVLILGSRSCALPFAIAQSYPEVTVCDSSLGRLELISARASSEQVENISLVCSHARDLYIKGQGREFFDLIIADFEFVTARENDGKIPWNHLCGCLRPGGRIFIAVSRQQSRWRRVLNRLIGKFRIPRESESIPIGYVPETVGRIRHYEFQPSFLSMERLSATKSELSHQQSVVIDDYDDKPTTMESSSFGLLYKISNNVENVDHAEHATLLDEIVFAGASGMSPDLRRITVQTRRSGRYVISVMDRIDPCRSRIIKVPFRKSAHARNEENHEALQRLHARIDLPDQLRRLIPEALSRGVVANWDYFVESDIEKSRGRQPTSINHIDWNVAQRQLGEALLILHTFSADFTAKGSDRLVTLEKNLAPLRMLGQSQKWDRIRLYLERFFCNSAIATVWSHGDAGLDNAVRDGDGSLLGIIDWETMDITGLPLYDWVVLSLSHRQRFRTGRGWQSLRWILDGQFDRFFGGLPITRYCKTLELHESMIAPLAIATWVSYCAHRLPNRGCDMRWLRRSVIDILPICDQAASVR